MELRLPLVVCRRGPRLVEAWVPSLLPGVRAMGPSLAEIRDTLMLSVMEHFEKARHTDMRRYQFSPHSSIAHVDVKTVAHDRVRRRRVELEGRVAVLLEHLGRGEDTLLLATPTRLPEARFLLRSAGSLSEALALRLGKYCVENNLESLAGFTAEKRERLEFLEVDADPPSPFPKHVSLSHGAASPSTGDEEEDDGAAMSVPRDETPAQREERRRRQRAQLRTLRQAARNLTHAASDGALERCYGREGMVSSLLDELDGRTGAAVVLVGPTGAGKTAVVHEVVRRLAARGASSGSRRDVWRIDGNRFIAGMMYVGQWEARARDMVRELVALDDVLFADDLASLVFAGRTSAENTNVAQFLEPHISRSELTVIAECTPERMELVRQEAPTFASLFRVIHVNAMSAPETVPVLLGSLRSTEESPDQRTARATPMAIEAVLQGTTRFLPNEALPGKAVRLLRSTLAASNGTWSHNARRYDRVHVMQTLQKQTGLPPFILGMQGARTRELIRKDFVAMVAGQPEAVDAVTDVVLAMQHGLSDPDKPLGTYLFVGPTGVGKTETAKALAKYLFGSKDRMVRFDMSEFTSGASIARLVGWPGAPDGELTSALRTQPFCVILLDEIEKAHPRVFDALLQLLGEGRLTDAAGHTADARQSVVIMTSNLGVREAAARTGFMKGDVEEARRHYVSAAQKFFRPEFFNRIDRVVPFRSLGPEALRLVLENALSDLLGRRGIRRGNVLVDVEESLLDLLVDQAFDPRYGARPLRRALERKLAVPLAHFLVRRNTRDAVLVRLRRAGDEMALSVTALRDAPKLPREPMHTEWSAPEVLTILQDLRTRMEELRESEAFAWLEAQRRAALDELGKTGAAAVPASSAVELLERFAWFRDALHNLEETELAEVSFREESVASDTADLHSWDRSSSYGRNRGIKGLRPRNTYVEVPVRAPTEAMAKRAASGVAQLRDEFEILEYQVRAAHAAGGDEAVTVLVSYVTPDFIAEPMTTIRWTIPQQGVRASQAWDELLPADGRPPRWTPTTPRTAVPTGVRIRRSCTVLEGPGVRAWVAHLKGYALLNAGVGEAMRTVLVRVQCVDGAGGLASVPAMEGDDESVLEVVIRVKREKNMVRAEHIATGLAGNATNAVLGAVLRARRKGLTATHVEGETADSDDDNERDEHDDGPGDESAERPEGDEPPKGERPTPEGAATGEALGQTRET